MNVLNSCKKNPVLKRIVLTSSSSTVRARDDLDPAVPLDESFWSSEELCEKLQVSNLCNAYEFLTPSQQQLLVMIQFLFCKDVVCSIKNSC